MFRISQPNQDLIKQLDRSSSTRFAPAVLEKDLVISEILSCLSQVQPEPLKFAFGGGTSLVKSRGLVDRLSEDIDIKVIHSAYASRSSIRGRMRQVRSETLQVLGNQGFVNIQTRARAAGLYSQFLIPYASVFEQREGIETSVTLEFYAQIALAPTSSLPVRSIAGIEANQLLNEFNFETIALEETIAQKLVAFLSKFDLLIEQPKLVRHIYDVWRTRHLPVDTSKMARIFDFSIEELQSRQRLALRPEAVMELFTERLSSLADSQELRQAFEYQMGILAVEPPTLESVTAIFEQVFTSVSRLSKFSRDG